MPSLLRRPKPTEPHHLHHIILSLSLPRSSRDVLNSLYPILLALRLLCSLLLCSSSRLLLANLREALLEVKRLGLGRLFGLLAEERDACAYLLDG